MQDTHSPQEVIDLYRYIKEVALLKRLVVTDIAMQPWSRFLKDIHDDAENIRIQFRDRLAKEPDVDDDADGSPASGHLLAPDLVRETEESPLLSVHRPSFTRCPEPPAILLPWLEPDWGNYNAALRTFENRTETDDADNILFEEAFADSDERVQALSLWQPIRDAWVEKQRIVEKTRSLFQKLYEVHTDLARDSETLELLVGNGLVRQIGNDAVRHPVLLKRVKSVFDAVSNTIHIVDTDTEPELETTVLNALTDIEYGIIKDLRQTVKENDCHPLDCNDAYDFLQGMTHQLSSESCFLRDASMRAGTGDHLIVSAEPVFFLRKRVDGTVKAIDAIIEHIQETGEVPGHIIDLIGGSQKEPPEDPGEPSIEAQLAAISGESVDILLAKEANREQLEIAQRVARHNAVLVQGPPGTGKTHTIANLLGHFLAEGKSVLITSHTKKALSVLKDKLPESIRDLCVSVLDDSNKDMIRAVTGMTSQMSSQTASGLKRDMHRLDRERQHVITQLAEVRKSIHRAMSKEYEPVVYQGTSCSTADAARFVRDHAETLSYIPGAVELDRLLPLSLEELQALYRSNEAVSREEETELRVLLPDPETLLSAVQYEQDQVRDKEMAITLQTLSELLGEALLLDVEKGCVLSQTHNPPTVLIERPSEKPLRALEAFCQPMQLSEEWMVQAAADGSHGGGYRQRWESLISVLEAAVSVSDELVAPLTGKHITWPEHMTKDVMDEGLERLEQILQKREKPSPLDFLTHKAAKSVYDAIRINGNPLSKREEASLLRRVLRLQQLREEVAMLWDALLSGKGAVPFLSLGEEPEQKAKGLIAHIQRYLNWYETEYGTLLAHLSASGFCLERTLPSEPMETREEQTRRLLLAVKERIPNLIQAADMLLERIAIQQRLSDCLVRLDAGTLGRSEVCRTLRNALENADVVAYRHAYETLVQLYPKYAMLTQREAFLERLSAVAPHWSEAIRNREGFHGQGTCPVDVLDAWKWKQLAGIVEAITETPFEAWQQKSADLSRLLRKKTEELATAKAWFHLLSRTETDTSLQLALQGWAQTIKKIGKGNGKMVPKLRQEARKLMAKCQRAVPAWIMTAASALENLDPAENRYDVVILDEASQSDMTALAIAFMAKRIIVVGDDKQVSPLAVGLDMGQIGRLQEALIKDLFPTWHLYEPTTSIYDISAQTFQPLMLREHFRCVPDIIGFSNRLSYDVKILPLREESSAKVFPAVVPYRVVDGERVPGHKTNEREAETLVSLVRACMDQPEYEGLTFGVISMLGDEQVKLLQQKLFARIAIDEYEKRRVLCGIAPHFQGDERDVVFLSLVDSNEGEGPLRKMSEGVQDSTRQRYNVAASRARDQMWVVHSLDYKRDLKTRDLRRELLEYVENPKAFASKMNAVERQAESPFEAAVAKSLIVAGYQISQQWTVGSYRIDMVVRYQGKKIGIECDGEQYHSSAESIRADMERQAILERLGWRFIRVRGSAYYRNPEKAMDGVFQQLEALGVVPEGLKDGLADELSDAISEGISEGMPEEISEDFSIGGVEKGTTDRLDDNAVVHSSLLERVILRAQLLRDAWQAGF